VRELLLQYLAEGTRVRADGDVIYVTEDFEVPDGSAGVVVRPFVCTGLSYVRWDIAPERTFATSHDSLALVEERSR
jgi:hypothetical protein